MNELTKPLQEAIDEDKPIYQDYFNRTEDMKQLVIRRRSQFDYGEWAIYLKQSGVLDSVTQRTTQRWLENATDVVFDELPPVELPSDVFNVIYADPPWKYDNSGFAMSPDYPLMETDDICKLQPNTPEDAVCFMWVTNPLLLDGLQVLAEWGFDYKTNIVWTKQNHTAGFYVFGKHEILLIGVKGSMLPTGEKFKSVIEGSNKVHSKKPRKVYGMIESMYPDAKYLEMFARNKRDNWQSYGNQLT